MFSPLIHLSVCVRGIVREELGQHRRCLRPENPNYNATRARLQRTVSVRSDRPHAWTRAFRHGRVPLSCLPRARLTFKLGAKRAELVQKFVPRSRVRIFRNEPTRSTPLDPKLIFWCISYHLGAFATIDNAIAEEIRICIYR